ncbi:MAG: hypothetical protein U0165_00095 [Polyangiaceae bacterium]
MTTDVRGLFAENVETALQSRGVQAAASTKEYLVRLLTDLALRPDGISLDQPITVQLNEALSAPTAERLEKLRCVGDGSLYVTSFFHEHLNRRGVDAGYVAKVGATAYGTAAAMLEPADSTRSTSLFTELAQRFDRFVEVLREVADALLVSSARSASDIVKVYERWLRTGSSSLAMGLGARGMLPMKPSGGVQ